MNEIIAHALTASLALFTLSDGPTDRAVTQVSKPAEPVQGTAAARPTEPSKGTPAAAKAAPVKPAAAPGQASDASKAAVPVKAAEPPRATEARPCEPIKPCTID